MPSVSKSQQRLFGWALSCKKGESKHCPKSVQQLADSMSEEDLLKYAKTSHKELPEEVAESIIESIINMSSEELDLFEKEEFSDEPPVSDDVKIPAPLVDNPEIPPGYIKADKRKDPGFFTPSLFKRPGDKKAKNERCLMNFDEFLKRINYQTHDGTTQYGHGSNLRGSNKTNI